MPKSGNICILVTGSAGFIGSSLLEPLARRAGVVRAGTRRRVQSAPAEPNIVDCSCDLDNSMQTEAAVAGSDLVVHAAYGSHAAMPEQCRTLLAAMSATGTSYLVYLSSIAVYGSAEGTIRENAALPAQVGGYGAAKSQCEDLIRSWVDEQPDARRAIILRPGIVYGAGSTLWVGKMIQRFRCGAWGTFGPSGDGLAALVHVDDVAEIILTACARLAEAPETLPAVGVINVVGPDTPTWNEYFQALAAADGQAPLREIPPRTLALRSIAAVLAKVWRRIGLPGGGRAALAPTSSELKLFSLKARFATDNVETLLGSRAKIGLQEGLRRSLHVR
jgi:nucleoside-diphosphate-sugar epimerase